MEDNVGISIDKLSKFGVNLVKQRENIDANARNSRLVTCLNQLLDLKQNKREHVDFFNGIFYRKYMHEMLCALIQICYSPNSHPTSNEKEVFIKWLDVDMFEEADVALIVSNLLMAQGSSSSIKNNSVLWFLNAIGKLLTKCLMRPNSVMNVTRAVLNQINALNDVTLASDWKKVYLFSYFTLFCD